MKLSKFFVFVGVLFVVALIVYLSTTPHGNDILLTGIVTGNDVIVSPQVAGRMIRLAVEEGSEVHKGDLIAELDPAELAAARDSAAANIRALEARVNSAQGTRSWTDDQTSAALRQAEATLTATRSQLTQAQANLWRDQQTYKRQQALFDGGVASAQDRDLADAAVRSSDAAVKALEDQGHAAEAQVAVARANRKQIDIQKDDLQATRAQLLQAHADKASTEVRLGYTKIYAPLDGVVSVRAARQGEVLQAGEPIVTILDVDHLWVQADVEETYIDFVALGQHLKILLPSGNTLEGTVIFKGVENDFATQRDVSRTKRDIKTFAIKVAVPNPQRRIILGMTATVVLPPLASTKNWWQRLTSAVQPTATQWVSFMGRTDTLVCPAQYCCSTCGQAGVPVLLRPGSGQTDPLPAAGALLAIFVHSRTSGVKTPEETADFMSCLPFLRQDEKARPTTRASFSAACTPATNNDRRFGLPNWNSTCSIAG